MVRRRTTLVAVAIIGIATSFAASAWVRTHVTAPDGGPGPCLFWGPRGHGFMIDSRGTPDVPGDAAFVAIRNGFKTWAGVGCSDLVFPDLGLSTDPANRRTGYVAGAYNRNLLFFRTANCEVIVPRSNPCWQTLSCGNAYDCWGHDSSVIATTTTTTNRSTGQLLDADVEFNDSVASDGTKYIFTTLDSPACDDLVMSNCVNIDVQNTATHEEGHTIGLAHSMIAEATMYATAPEGETSKRVLAADDIDAICSIYPKGAATATCLGDPIEFTVTGESDNKGCGCTSSGSASPTLEGGLAAIAIWTVFRSQARRRAL